MILMLVLVGQPDGIGFLIAAKSILRFNELARDATSGPANTSSSARWRASPGRLAAALRHAAAAAPRSPPLRSPPPHYLRSKRQETETPMFGIPGKPPVTLTPAADAPDRPPDGARRQPRACASASRRAAAPAWNTPWNTSPRSTRIDEVVEQDGARVMIAPMAQMFLFGTEIDYATGLLECGLPLQQPQRRRSLRLRRIDQVQDAPAEGPAE